MVNSLYIETRDLRTTSLGPWFYILTIDLEAVYDLYIGTCIYVYTSHVLRKHSNGELA